VTIERFDPAAFDVVDPAVQGELSLGEGQGDRGMGSKVNELGDDVLADHAGELVAVGGVMMRGIHRLGCVGMVQPAAHRREMAEIMVMRDRRHGAAVRMSADHHVANAQHGDRILHRRGNPARLRPERRHDVAGVANHEHLARFALCEQLGHDAAVRAGDEQRARRLLVRQRLKQAFAFGKRLCPELPDTFDQLFHDVFLSERGRILWSRGISVQDLFLLITISLSYDMMLLRHARYLIAVVDHGSFTRAASALHVSQPALSQQIRQLEERLGAHLLDRTGRVVRATDAGEAFLAYARRALADLEAGERAVRDVHDLSSGVLRIGFTPTFIPYLAGPVVQQFRERHPGVTLNIRSLGQSDMEAALGADALDVGIGFTEIRADDIDCLPLYEEILTVIVGECHPKACLGVAMDAPALAEEPLALLGPSFATRITIDLYFRRVGIRPRVVVEANSNSAIVEIIRHSALATILPEAVAREQPGICAIPLIPALDPRYVALLQRRGGYRSAASRAFVDLMLGEARGDIG